MTTSWKKSLANLPQGQTDSPILFALLLNYVNLKNMDEIIKESHLYDVSKKCNEDSKKLYNLNDFEKIKRINEGNEDQIECKINNNDENEKMYQIDEYGYLNAKGFGVDLSNFADDCSLAMEPLFEKSELSKYIKFGYRLNLQTAIDQFYNWTRYYQLIIGPVKCSTVTFSRKLHFRAYVYKLDGNKLELIHSNQNGPQKCKHNEKLNYINPFDQDNESNGDSDLENLNQNGEKIKKTKDSDNNVKNSIYRVKKSGIDKTRHKMAKHELPLMCKNIFFRPAIIL